MSAESRQTRLLPALLMLAFLALYGSTVARGVLTADNAEFQWVGTQLGLAHPPGFPLYTILAHLITRLLPFVQPAVAINLLSVITSTLTLWLVYDMSVRLTARPIAGVVSALGLGTMTTFWAQATTANVRSMTALFAALALWALIHDRDHGGSRCWAAVFAMALGFGFTHHLSLAFMGLVMVLWFLWHNWRRWPQLLPGLLGLLPWLYLPLREPQLRTSEAFLEYALGLGFGGDFFHFITPSDLWLRAGVMRNVLQFQSADALLLAALIGWILLLRQQRAIGLLLGGTFLLHTFITATYRAPQTVEYMLPAYVPLALCIGAVALQLPSAERTSRFQQALLVVLLITAGWQGMSRYRSFQALAFDDSTTQFVDKLLIDSSADSIILSNWHWLNALRYRHHIDGVGQVDEIEYVAPQGVSYGENWRDAVVGNRARGRSVVATNTYPAPYQRLLAPQPLGPANYWPQRSEPLGTSLQATFGDTIQLLSVMPEQRAVAVGEEMAVVVQWRLAPEREFQPATLFIHLVGPDGQIYAQYDRPLRFTEFTVRLPFTPRPGALPGSYRLLAGVYLADGTPLLDASAEPRTHIGTIDVTGARWRPYTRNPVILGPRNERGDRLIGYDYDTTLPGRLRTYLHFRSDAGNFYSQTYDNAPIVTVGTRTIDATGQCDSGCHYVPLGRGIIWTGSRLHGSLAAGTTIQLDQQFVSLRPNTADLAVSVSLIGFGSDGVSWEWREQSDQIPATGAIPTLKWIQGSHIRDPHRITIPSTATPGQALSGQLILYDAFTNQTIPILDEGITASGVGISIFSSSIFQ